MDLQLTGKIALVVASSKGLGKAIATQLATEGCDVMLTSRNAEQLAATRQQLLPSARGRVECCPCDITKLKDIQSLVAVTRERLGPVDILINNAGGPPGGGFEQIDDAAWQSAFELNLLSYVRLIRRSSARHEAAGRTDHQCHLLIDQATDSGTDSLQRFPHGDPRPGKKPGRRTGPLQHPGQYGRSGTDCDRSHQLP